MDPVPRRLSVCPPFNEGRSAQLRAQLHDWLHSPAMNELVALHGSTLREGASLAETLSFLEDFSERWDFRRKARERQAASGNERSQDVGGSARWQITETGLPPEEEGRVRALARELGLVDSQVPVHASFDYFLILGGARLSNLLRPQHAAELVQKHGISVGHIVLLGGSRPVMETERDATDTYAPDAATEFDLMNQGAANAFGLDLERRQEESHEDIANANRNWHRWRFSPDTNDLKVPLTSLAAPSLEPEKRRANTADSYAFFSETLDPRPGARCLLVTSQIYVPYQHLEAVRNLAIPFDVEVETVGFPSEWQAGLQGMQSAANYLQEIRSSIQAAGRLYRQYLKTTN
jgi:hypothetical protein